MFNRISILLLSFFIIFPQPAFARDWGYSHNYFIKKKFNDKWSLVSRSLFTSRNDMRDVFLGVVDIGVSHNTARWLSLGVSYRGSWFRTSGGWGYENRPLVNITLKGLAKGYRLSNRSRFEFRFFEYGSEDDIRYRNEVKIITPFKLTRFKLQPFLEEEFFYSFNTGEVNMNWLTPGVSYAVNDNLKVKIGYRWLTQKLSDRWINRNVLVTGISYLF